MDAGGKLGYLVDGGIFRGGRSPDGGRRPQVGPAETPSSEETQSEDRHTSSPCWRRNRRPRQTECCCPRSSATHSTPVCTLFKANRTCFSGCRDARGLCPVDTRRLPIVVLLDWHHHDCHGLKREWKRSTRKVGLTTRRLVEVEGCIPGAEPHRRRGTGSLVLWRRRGPASGLSGRSGDLSHPTPISRRAAELPEERGKPWEACFSGPATIQPHAEN